MKTRYMRVIFPLVPTRHAERLRSQMLSVLLSINGKVKLYARGKPVDIPIAYYHLALNNNVEMFVSTVKGDGRRAVGQLRKLNNFIRRTAAKVGAP